MIETNPEMKGLSEGEVKARLRRYGYNELAATDQKTFLKIALGVIKEPLLLLLLLTRAIYFLWRSISDGFVNAAAIRNDVIAYLIY